MPKKMTSVRINEEVLRKAREHEINVSAFLEIKLREYLALIEGEGRNCSSSKSNNKITLGTGFEPASSIATSALEADAFPLSHPSKNVLESIY